MCVCSRNTSAARSEVAGVLMAVVLTGRLVAVLIGGWAGS